jgi:hypothetical protein
MPGIALIGRERMSDEQTTTPSPWPGRLTLALAAVLLAVVVITLPFVIRSMWVELIEGEAATQYDGLTGDEVSFEEGGTNFSEMSYFTIAVIDIDEATQVATLGLSGHRVCSTDCPGIVVTLYSLHDAGMRRGMPPSVTLDLPGGDHVFSQTVQLPLRGNPNVYPFDHYELTLGMVLAVTLPDGTVQRARAIDLRDRAVFTLQENVAGLNMRPPTVVDPQHVEAESDPFAFLVVQELEFRRPAYQQLLAVLLVTLISVSAAFALFLRSVNDLVLGFGGLILGIWGVRSIVVPNPPSDVNAVDLALAGVILLLLAALSVRTARHYVRPSTDP